MRDLHTLTELQLALLDIVWRRGEATAADVWAAQESSLGLARNTVDTVLTRLESDGVLTHRVRGRAFVFRATVTRDDVRRASVRALADQLYSGSVVGMVSHALRDAPVDPAEIEEVRRMLDEAREEG